MEAKEIDMKSCRICLTTKKQLCPLFRYKLSGNYAEMLTAIADVKVASNDGLPDKICTKCSVSLEKAFLLKTIAERSDRKLRKIQAKSTKHATTKKIVFDSFVEVKSELAPINSKVKKEPMWEMEIENIDKPIETMDGKDIVIANTVIRKVEPGAEDKSIKVDDERENDDLTRSSRSRTSANQTTTLSDFDTEYLDDDIFQDDDDADYVPPEETNPVKIKKFKKPKLGDIRVFKDQKILRTLKVAEKAENSQRVVGKLKKADGKTKSTTITCYPILKNGSRGAPILLKRPKDATILKFHPNYKRSSDGRVSRDKSSIRTIKNPKAMEQPKQKEKLVCPICGILTYTLGNHIATHEEKKKYTCTECNKSFSQKGNLFVHMKQHTGVKDHICEVCGAGFYSQKSLVRHNLIHKGERPFACNLCTKKFIARCDLNRHLKIHSGYKPFKCPICSMSFNAKHQLQNHERMHTGERPYECQICNVAFSYKVNLNNHVYKVHGVNLKFKSIHIVTEEILRKEIGLASEARTATAISHIMPPSHMDEVPNPGAHETVPHMTEYKHEEVHIPSDYSV